MVQEQDIKKLKAVLHITEKYIIQYTSALINIYLEKC